MQIRINTMDELFGRGPWPAGIRSVERGMYPPTNVDSTPEKVDVYLFAASIRG
jgi:HSP20 family protein